MANTSAVYARIDNDIKSGSEDVLSRLGITPSSAIQMFYAQIVLLQGLPFTPRIPAKSPLSLVGITRTQLDAVIGRGVDSLDAGIGVSEEEA